MDNANNPELITNSPIPPQQNNGKSKVFLFIALVIFLAAAGAGGYLLGSKNQSLPPSPTPKPITKITVPTPSASETASWRIYTDKKYGFEFKYLQNFKIAEGLGQYFLNEKPIIELTSDSFNYLHNQIDAYFTVSAKPNAKSECEYIPRGVLNTERNKVINGISFTMFSTTGAAAGNTHSNTIFHHLKDDLTCYEIVTTIHESSDGNTPEALPKINEQKIILNNQLDQILSTLKFLDQTLTNTNSDWIKYSDSQYKFEFKAPAQFVKAGHGGPTMFGFDLINGKSMTIIFDIMQMDEQDPYQWVINHGPKAQAPESTLFPNIGNINKSTRNGYPTIEYEKNDEKEKIKIKYVVFSSNGNGYIFGFNIFEDNFSTNSLIDQILSTFKFLD